MRKYLLLIAIVGLNANNDILSHQDQVDSLIKVYEHIRNPEWGNAVSGSKCRLGIEKDIYITGEPIYLQFAYESLNEKEACVLDSLYRKDNKEFYHQFLDNLKVIDSDGKKLCLNHTLEQCSYQEFDAFFRLIRIQLDLFYDMQQTDTYYVTATFPSIKGNNDILKSQTLEIIIVDENYLNLSATTDNNVISLDQPTYLHVKLSTSNENGLLFRPSGLSFHLGACTYFAWSPDDYSSFVHISEIPTVKKYNISHLKWRLINPIMSISPPPKPLKEFFKKGEKRPFWVNLSGVIDGKVFEIVSDTIEVKIK